ncbi:HNH endonuclease [Undibacterium sp. CY18W]|uniref:HNH endonuclease n=1 Tax=Undibacterium hunanense TaxID=2762292 RepID=A0ABR6ZU68_9BURK|nr:HNH endonuclease [Undibacterium hunanense]MBC3919412.1 HNH endonuclease [Undibacterium hunanense]
MQQKKNWFYAAGIVWPILIEAAKHGETVTYEDVAPLIDTNPLSVGYALSPIQDYCLTNRLPPLTILVVGKKSHVPGNGFIAWDISDLQSGIQSVFNFQWSSVINPYNEFSIIDTPESLALQIYNDPKCREQIYIKVKVRGIAQSIFRTVLLKAYNYQCAFCQFSQMEALDAAHIIPWEKANSDQRMDPKNGLLLCALHHRLFDSGRITLNESFQIEYHPLNNNRNLSATDKFLTSDLHGKSVKIPVRSDLQPSERYLIERRAFPKLGNIT